MEKVVQDKRQRDDNDLQDRGQDQTEDEEVKTRRSKRARNENRLDPIFLFFNGRKDPPLPGKRQRCDSLRRSDTLFLLGDRVPDVVGESSGCTRAVFNWVILMHIRGQVLCEEYCKMFLRVPMDARSAIAGNDQRSDVIGMRNRVLRRTGPGTTSSEKSTISSQDVNVSLDWGVKVYVLGVRESSGITYGNSGLEGSVRVGNGHNSGFMGC
ncbi:hypothetical protein Tco_0915331 [Tanacetum coccineum]